MMICSIMLMIGHSFAHWARSNFPSNDSLQTVGWRGGHVADPLFRRWVVDEVRRRGASDVLLAAGGNDLSQNYFNVRAMEEFFTELVVALLAVGVVRITILPISPRATSRRGGASVKEYRRRRRLLNQGLCRRFPGPLRNQLTVGFPGEPARVPPCIPL